MQEHLIRSKQMAQFVASGYLKFENMVPKDLCEACLEEMRANNLGMGFGMFSLGSEWLRQERNSFRTPSCPRVATAPAS